MPDPILKVGGGKPVDVTFYRRDFRFTKTGVTFVPRRLRKDDLREPARGCKFGESAMRRGIQLGLTVEQVETVIAQATSGTQSTGPVTAALMRPGELTVSPLREDKRLSRSLLCGLVVLVSFPADGGERGIKEIARELSLSTSTAHRYIRTLLTVGLLEQNPRTRGYCRCRV
jgi:hypothetical protein